VQVRPLTNDERGLIEAIVDALPTSLRRLVALDLGSSMIEQVNPGRSRFVFHIDGYERPAYRGQHPVPVEGTMKDQDGAELHVLLHLDENDRLLELEFVRWVGGPVLGPLWPSFELYEGTTSPRPRH
jgi:hypothetical protein